MITAIPAHELEPEQTPGQQISEAWREALEIYDLPEEE
jgi:hypothetical protein